MAAPEWLRRPPAARTRPSACPRTKDDEEPRKVPDGEGRRSRADGRELRFESAFELAPIGMALVDRKGRWLEVNAAFCRITGHSRSSLDATTLPEITVPEDLHLDTGLNQDLLVGRISSYQVEKRYRHAEGHSLWVLVSVSLVRDDDGHPLYTILQIEDISKRREIARSLQYLVDRDFLTGLFNRRRFDCDLAREARRSARYGSSGAVVLVDLDRFKEVNDAFGHLAGDELLKAVAGTLARRMRQTDVLARVGGDEFAVLLTQTGAEQARIVAEGIVESVRRDVPRDVPRDGERSIRVTASVGVALLDGLAPEEIMDAADRAMYEAKAAGRDRIAMAGFPAPANRGRTPSASSERR